MLRWSRDQSEEWEIFLGVMNWLLIGTSRGEGRTNVWFDWELFLIRESNRMKSTRRSIELVHPPETSTLVFAPNLNDTVPCGVAPCFLAKEMRIIQTPPTASLREQRCCTPELEWSARLVINVRYACLSSSFSMRRLWLFSHEQDLSLVDVVC